MALYSVSSGSVPQASDIDQFYDMFMGNHDVGSIKLFPPINPPNTVPSATAVTGGSLGIGVYKYVVTFVTGYKKSNGTTNTTGETLPTSNSSSVTTTSGNQNVSLTSIPTAIGMGNSVIARNIYRTTVGGSTYLFVAQIADNSTTTFTDTVADASLGQAVPTKNTTGASFGFMLNGTVGSPFVTSAYPLTNVSSVSVGTSGSVGSNLVASTTYYYAITAVGWDGTETPLGGGLSATTGTTPYPVTVNWASTLNVYYYKLYRSTGNSSSYQFLASVSNTSTSYTDTGSISPSGAAPTLNYSGALRGPTVQISEQSLGNSVSNFWSLQSMNGTLSARWGYNQTATWSVDSTGRMTINGTSGRFTVQNWDGSNNFWFTTGQDAEPKNLGLGFTRNGAGDLVTISLGASNTTNTVVSGTLSANSYNVWSDDYTKKSYSYMYLNSNQAISGTNQWVKIGYNVTQYDTLTELTPAGYSRFTAKTAGSYEVSASVYFTGVSGSPFVFISVFKNGAHYARLWGNSLTAGQNTVAAGGTNILLAANDYVEIFYYSSATTATISAGVDSTYFIVNRGI